ncbi:hypothetical protein DNTS_031911 [Danionella cerebrum]|uniref:Arginine vasopressin-induced protein 1/transcriptional and immune response regulator domain-containing protein n=1 Tax=Danionella cerebrum TaxID=2873325 RepID=A0A553RIW9_9TELE|nr:hypothetical protein DNTS_031911 [Danionella translucida]
MALQSWNHAIIKDFSRKPHLFLCIAPSRNDEKLRLVNLSAETRLTIHSRDKCHHIRQAEMPADRALGAEISKTRHAGRKPNKEQHSSLLTALSTYSSRFLVQMSLVVSLSAQLLNVGGTAVNLFNQPLAPGMCRQGNSSCLRQSSCSPGARPQSNASCSLSKGKEGFHADAAVDAQLDEIKLARSCRHSRGSSIIAGISSARGSGWRNSSGAARLSKVGDSNAARQHRSRKMSSDMYSESRRVCPFIHGNRFDTANRKRAVANIFENVNQDALMRLFQKTGDMKAEERVRSIFSFAHDPEETAKALMALKQRKKDKFLRIAGIVRNFLKLR